MIPKDGALGIQRWRKESVLCRNIDRPNRHTQSQHDTTSVNKGVDAVFGSPENETFAQRGGRKKFIKVLSFILDFSDKQEFTIMTEPVGHTTVK